MSRLQINLIGYLVVVHGQREAESVVFVNACADQTLTHPWHQPTLAVDRRDLMPASDRPDAVYPEFDAAWNIADTVVTIAPRTGPVHTGGAAFHVVDEEGQAPANPDDPQSWRNPYWLADLGDNRVPYLRPDWRTSPAAASRVDFAGGSLEGGRPIEPLRSMLFQIGTHSKVRAMTDRVRYTLDASADGFEITLRRSGLTRRLWLRARDATGLITAEMYSFPMSERKAHDHEAASAPSRTFEHFSGYFELLANAPSSPDDRILFQRGFHRPPPDQDGPSCIVSRLAVP